MGSLTVWLSLTERVPASRLLPQPVGSRARPDRGRRRCWEACGARIICSAARVTIVAGKGGVGKTTVSGRPRPAGGQCRVHDPDHRGGRQERAARPVRTTAPLTYQETVLLEAGPMGSGSAEVRARTLTPDDALLEYLDDHGMRRISRRLVSSGTLDVVATAVPGIKDILVLGKVKQLEPRPRRAGLAPRTSSWSTRRQPATR